MPKTNWKAQLIIAMLLSATAHADDANSSAAGHNALPAIALFAATPANELPYVSHYHRFRLVDSMLYSDKQRRPIVQIDFRDTSFLGRMSKLRGVSLVTFAEFRRARLFLGVNNDGLVGLHFNALPVDSRSSHPEWLRMPYLTTPTLPGPGR
jgi:hypothetical protein